MAVATVVKRYLPQYAFKSSKLKMFPKGLVKTAPALVEEVGAE